MEIGKLLDRTARALAFALLAACACAAQAQEPAMRYYEIQGTSVRALGEAMNRHGPRGFHAYTGWHVSYRYNTVLQGGRCSVASAQAELRGEITFPRWTKRAGAPADLVAKWERYAAALLAHEQGHMDYGRELARAVEAELPRVPAAADCRALDGAVRARFSELHRDVTARERAYDATTGHGRTQGVVFQ